MYWGNIIRFLMFDKNKKIIADLQQFRCVYKSLAFLSPMSVFSPWIFRRLEKARTCGILRKPRHF
jgi:hypothetical protein